MLSEQWYQSVLSSSINNTAVKPTLSLWVRELYREFWPCVLHLFASLCKDLITFLASGVEAFNAVEKLVDKLVDCGKTQLWAREIKQQLRLSKQYLEGDCKVGAYFIIMRCPCRSDEVNFLLWFTATPFFLSKSSLCLIYETTVYNSL